MKTALFCVWIWFSFAIMAGESKRFSITVNDHCLDVPIALSLDELGFYNFTDSLSLFEIVGKKEKGIPVQIEPGNPYKLWFILDGLTTRDDKREFVVRTRVKKMMPAEITSYTLNKSNENIVIKRNHQTVLKYRYTSLFPPDGVDPLYKRSGFIHPLYSPGGETLTRVQAPDHYHHYGIWGPWTLTRINDRKVDFWNLALGEGTVKFSKFISGVSGVVYTGFQTLQEHIDFGGMGPDQTAINEILDVRVWNANDKVWIIDYTSTLNTPLPGGILLEAYRYGGGIGFRATEKWTKDNSTVLTSEGKTRVDADGSMARWAIIEGESAVPEGRSGILFMSHPSNRMHPEPMRVWPMDANNGRGDVFFEFTPIRYEDWELKHLNNYTLRYRMIIFDSALDTELAELYWNSFAKHLKIQIN